MDLLSTRTPMPLTQPTEEKQQPVGARLLDNYVRNADHYEAEDVTPEFLAKHTYAKEGAASGLDFDSWSKQNGVTDFLANAQTTVAKNREQAAWDAAQPETRGFLAGTGAALGRGAMNVVGSMGHTLALADATPNAIDTDKGILDRAGEGMTKWAEDKKAKTQFMRPTMEEEKGETGAVKKAWEGGVESMVTSTAPMAAGFAGAKAGGALGAPLGPAGAAIGATIGGLGAYGLARFGMFGAGVYGDTYDKTYAELKQKNPGMGEDEVRRIANKGAWTDAISENVSEAVGDAAAFYTFGGSKVLQQPLKATIKDVMKRGLKGYATDVAKQMPFEVGSEMANAAVGANWRQEAGLQGGDMAEAAKEAIGPAVVMSLLMGLGVAGHTEIKARRTLANINGADPEVRAKAAGEIEKQIEERTGDKELAASWRQNAIEKISSGEEIELDEQLVKFGANRARIDAADAGQDIPVVTDETEQELVQAAETVTPAEALLTGGEKQRPEDVLLGTDPIIPEPFNPAAQSPVIEQQRQAFDAAYAQDGLEEAPSAEEIAPVEAQAAEPQDLDAEWNRRMEDRQVEADARALDAEWDTRQRIQELDAEIKRLSTGRGKGTKKRLEAAQVAKQERKRLMDMLAMGQAQAAAQSQSLSDLYSAQEAKSTATEEMLSAGVDALFDGDDGDDIVAQPADAQQPAPQQNPSIPYDTVSFVGVGQPLARSSGESPLINFGDRIMTVRVINGVQVPFYLSSGHGGKKDVPSGKWYPFFGIGADGWINKTGGQEMTGYYGMQELRAAAEELDATIGDVRGDKSVPRVSRGGRHIDFLNTGFTPAENGHSTTPKIVRDNIENLRQRLSQNSAPAVQDATVTSDNLDAEWSKRQAEMEERAALLRKRAENLTAPEGKKNSPAREAKLQEVQAELQQIEAQQLSPATDSIVAPPSAVDEGAISAPEIKTELDAVANEAATSPLNDTPEPTQAQKEAGNYKKGHVRINGLDFSIENPKGSERKGVDKDGTPWSTTMRNHYAYIKGSVGADKDHVDAFLSDAPESGRVFIVDQVDPKTGAFDEHKAMVGFETEAQAREAYLSNYSEGWQGLGAVTPMEHADFKKWVFSKKTKKPVGDISKADRPGAETVTAPAQADVRLDHYPVRTKTDSSIEHVLGLKGVVNMGGAEGRTVYRVPAKLMTPARLSKLLTEDEAKRDRSDPRGTESYQIKYYGEITGDWTTAEAKDWAIIDRREQQAQRKKDIAASESSSRENNFSWFYGLPQHEQQRAKQEWTERMGQLGRAANDFLHRRSAFEEDVAAGRISPAQAEEVVDSAASHGFVHNDDVRVIKSRIAAISAPDSAGAKASTISQKADESDLRYMTRETLERELNNARYSYKRKPSEMGKILVEQRAVKLEDFYKKNPDIDRKHQPTPSAETSKKEPWQMTRGDYYQSVRNNEGAGKSNVRARPNWSEIKKIVGFDFFAEGNEVQPLKKQRFSGGFSEEQEAAIKDALSVQGFAVDKTRVRNNEEQDIPKGGGWRARSRDVFPTSPEHERSVRKALSEGKPVPAEVLAEYPDLAPQKAEQPGAKTFETAQEGDIYEAEIGGKKRFLIRGDNPRGGGDSIHDTFEQAVAYKEERARIDKANAETAERNKKKEDEQSAKAASDKAKYEDVKGYTDSMTPLARGLTLKRLNSPIRHNGQVMTRKEFVEKLVAEGAEITARQENKIKDMSRSQWNRATNKEQDDHRRKQAAAGKVTVHSIGDFDVSKTEYDYAKHLMGQDAPVQKSEDKTLTATRESLIEGYRIDVEETQGGKTYRMIAPDGSKIAYVSPSASTLPQEHADTLVKAMVDHFIKSGDVKKTDAQAETQAATGIDAVVDHFAKKLYSGAKYTNIVQARKEAAEVTGKEVKGGTDMAKMVDEAIELAVVKTARKMIREMRGKGATDLEIYQDLVALYAQQPTLGTRTSTSVAQQAYSTPVPIAFLASRLAGIKADTRVLEPTAGNGMLLLEADHPVVNELNPDRAARLSSLGFKVGEMDAASEEFVTKVSHHVDAVVANPPFGRVYDENGEAKSWTVAGYETKELDHAIVLRSLELLLPDGKSALIIGGKQGEGKNRSLKYHAVAQRQFYKALFDNFKVVDHFTIDGKLYAKQGAGFPIDIIVIDGRGKTEGRKFPAADPPRIYNSFEALEELFNEKSMGSKVEVTGDDAGFSDGMDGDRKQGELAGTGGDTAAGVDTTGGRTETGNQELSGDTGERGADRPLRGPGRTGKGQQNGDRQSAGQAGAGAQTNRDDRGREEGLPAQAEQSDAGMVRGDDATGMGGRGSDGISLDALMGEWDRQEEASKQKQQSEKKPTTEKTAAERMAESAESLNKNLQAALDVFSQFGGLSVKVVKEGDPVNQTLYEAIRPHLLAAYKDLKNMGLAGADLIREFVAKARAVFGDKSAQARPYFEKFAGEIVEMERATEKRDEKPSTPPVKKKSEAAQSGTELQDPYVPRSKSSKMGTLVPKNMTTPLKNALNRLEEERGDIDVYVAKELGYSKKELEEYFAGEQIDAIALAINNIDKGAGFIIGDQTGIGKGRVNAAIMRYAKRKNMVPVFVTMKPDLYADMVRDLQDIGMKGFNPLPTNAGLTGDKAIPLPDGRTLRTASAAKHSTVLESQGKSFVDGYDAVFTTYSQLQSVKGADTARREFIRNIAPKAVFILDESHNAGGSESQARKKKGAQPNTADFIRAVLGMTENGVFYSSATYAKRPDVMSLYFKTDMRHAVDDISSLASAISAGGIPLQQIVAAQLTESGQYIRRERSFEGASVDVAPAKADMKAAEQSATIMRSILAFDKIKQKALSDLNDSAMGEGEGVGDSGATGEKGASSTNFTSVMHNLIGQSLLAMKADAAVEEAIAARKRGEKPIITLANTMGSFIAEHVAAEEISLGQEITLSFKDLYRRYLEKTRTLTRRDSHGKIIEQRVLTDEELGPEGVAAYNASLAEIEQSNFGDLPISPIDYITSKLNAAGISVGEITGRTAAVDYSDGIPVYRSRRPSPAANIETMRSFNSGQTDAIILNQSGSTGISLHSSSTFADTSKRTMIIVQPELNIDVFMQTLGRVFRTGQVVPPAYRLLTSDLPAEKRPAAVLGKKMAGLNANTTASRKTDTTFQNIPDFLNDYGDLVTALIMEENPEIHHALGSPLKEGDVGYEREGAVRKVTGRIPLLPLKEQQELYDMIEGEYNDLLAQLEATGSSNLEAKTLKLDAKLISSSDLTTAKDVGGNSPFAAESKVGLFDVKSLGKPYSPDQVRKLIEQGQANKPDIEKTREDTIAWLEKRLESVKDAAAKTDLELRVGGQYASVQTILSKYEIGSPVLVSTMGNTYSGIITRIDHKGSGNPSAPSSWKMTVAIADAARQIVVPFSKIQTGMERQDAPAEMRLGQVMVKNSSKSLNTVLDEFARGQTTSREKRYIAYGNVLAAYSAVRNEGQIVNFEDSEGNIRAGIMFKKNATLSEIVGAADVSVPDYESMVKFFDRTRDNGMLSSSDKNLKISRQGGYWTFLTPASKAKGAQFFLNGKLVEAAGRDFVKSGNSMKVTANADTAAKMINVLREQGFGIIAASHASEAREVMGLDNNEESGASNPQYSIAPTTPTPIDLRAAFPWADSITERDGKTIITKGKVSFAVEQVESIKPDEISFKLAYGRKPGSQDQIAGQYQDGTITLSKMADKWTVQHEFEHFLEDMGLITAFEQAVLNSAIKRAERDGTLGFDAAPNGKRMKDAELRAYYIQNALAKRDFDRKTTLGRVLQKIADFIDALVNLAMRTSRGVVRDVESGRAMGKTAGGKSKFMLPMLQAAYHGSPHRFDKFTLDAIGTGEGAQAYGWGLYFAGKKEIAEHYRNALAVSAKAQGMQFNKDGTPNRVGYVVALLDAGIAEADILDGLEVLEDTMTDKERLAVLESGKKTYAAMKKAGQLYKVDIPEDDVMLHWDKSLSEQPKKVREAFREIDKRYPHADPNPSDRYRTAKDFYKDLSRELGRSDKAASEYLNSIGIKGIKYLDGSSRSDGAGTFNYVIFDDAAIEVLETYYQTAQAAGATAEELAEDPRIQYAIANMQQARELRDDILKRPEVFGLFKNINTQLHKAMRQPAFKRIFDRFHAAAGTQQRAAARSASLAPDILPDHSGGFKQSVRELLTKTSEFSAADLRHVSKVLSMETLAGKNPSPFAGHRLTDDELARIERGETVKVGDNDVRMNGKQVRLYRQTRAALDQMLREMGTSEAWRIIRGVLTTHQSTAGDFDAKDYWEVFANNPLEAADAMKGLLEREKVKADARLTRATQDLRVLTGADDMDGAKEWGKQLVKLNKAIDNVGKFSQKQLEDDDLDELVAKRERRIDRLAEELGISAGEADATLKEYKGMVKEHTAATTHVENVKGATKSIGDVFAKTDQLIKAGYMPLSRFGQYRIDVRDEDGNLLHASFYDTSTEANRERRKLMSAFGQTGIVGEVETVSQEDWKLYQGQNPEALRLFAEAAGAESDEAIQAYYQDAISSRSALKRLINRQGYAGYSDDLQRILASFITSGSKRIGQNYHAADINDMVKDKSLPGDLRDEAIRLKSFIENPGDAGSSFRAFAANWYMLGSLMSAAWNGTQVVTSSLPELYKHSGSVGRSTKDIFGAYRSMVRKGSDLTQTEKQALDRAQEDGTVDAAEIHHLYAQATKRFINKLGSGEAAKKVGAFLRLWGMPFSWFETVNRKATFLAAYRMAERQGVDDPYALARSIVDVSQGIYSKHNRPNVARSAVGGAVLTFMQYKIMTLEQIARNAKEGGQARKAAALQLAIIAAMGGWKALPGIEDITDLYDIIAQVIFGQAVLSKKSMREAIEKGSKDAAGLVLEKDAADAVGKFFADAVNSGIVTAALPVDVSTRASMGSLVPGLKLLKPSVQYRDSIVFDMAGVPGSMIDSLIDASGMMLRGDMGGAAMRLAPNAVAAAAKGVDILATGEIKNTRGKKITDGDMVDGALQTIGAQPKAKSRINSRLYENQELKNLAQQEEKSIVGQWADAYDAKGIDARNSAIQAARQRIVDWNRRNPEWPIAIKQTQVLNELKNRKKTTVELATKTAPKELRPSMAVH